MRMLDHEPIDPEIADSLDAIDAVLAGEPVEPEYAELAEIALLLAADRPAVPATFAQSLDARVARRFASQSAPAPRRKGRWLTKGFWEASGALVAGVALIVGLVVLVGGQHGGSNASSSSASYSSAGAASASAGAASSSSGSASTPTRAFAAPSSGSQKSAASSAAAATAPLQPPTNGRKVVQSAQLQLAAARDRIDDVAQQVYDVIGGLGGIVVNSTVTQSAGPGGNAQFQLSIPSGSLAQAMSRLSSLNYASVLSRTDASQDITDQYGAAQRALVDARALRTSLLRQLAGAVTTEQVDSLKAQIHDAEASISSDQATLNRLNHSVGFSRLSLQINPRSTPTPVSHGSGGFGIGRAAHDAGRVLTVAAGVALIALAALTPVALVAALVWWLGAAFRRRRREQALDLA
jgi:Domain of unknown function (DUF4349)